MHLEVQLAKKKTVVRRHKKVVKRVKKNGVLVSTTTTEEPGPDTGSPKIGATPVGGIGRNGGKIVRRKKRKRTYRKKATKT